MESLVSLGKEMLQNIAEHAASYQLGQTILKKLDRGLWVIEKCARWAVPPPLDQDERPQPELVRPLPWVFFFLTLVVLRVTRETISLANLIMGKPPLRSADVVMFIQSKRRYLRTLKYQGSRMMRSRTSSQPQQPWYSGLNSLFELTMCFRRQSFNYGNNNTTQVTNNDEVVVIKRNKHGHHEEATIASSLRETENTMERLIEKMMIDLNAESDEDSNYTLANANSAISNVSEYAEADQDTVSKASMNQPQETEISQTNGDDIHFSPNKNNLTSSTPEKKYFENKEQKENSDTEAYRSVESEESDETILENSPVKNENDTPKREDNIVNEPNTKNAVSNNTKSHNLNSKVLQTSEDSALPPLGETEAIKAKFETENFLKNESANAQRIPKKEHKIANGRTVKSVPSKKKANNHRERRSSNDQHQQKSLPSQSSF